LFPSAALAAAAARAIRRERNRVLQYDWPEGREGLRQWIASRLRDRGADVAANEVIVTSGAQQAVLVTAQLVLRPGFRVALDAESYPGALDAFAARGAVPVRPGTPAACAYTMPALGR
jgi:2-aminoadipate transaminase